MKVRDCCFVVGMLAPISQSSLAEQVRNIAPPAYTALNPSGGGFTNDSGQFSQNFDYSIGKWVMMPRYQTTYSGHSPTANLSSYYALSNTGFSPVQIGLETFQRSGDGGNSAQSIFQLQNYKGGMLMISWMAPASIYSKHTVYQYAFDNCGARSGVNDSWCPSPPVYLPQRPRVFQGVTNANDTQHGLAVQANITVQQWDSYASSPTGQLAFTFILRDQDGGKLEYVIYVFHSGGYVGKDSSPAVSYDGNHCFIESSVKKNSRPMYFTTVKTDSGGDFSSTTFPWTSPFFRVYVTPQNLTNAINIINNTAGCQRVNSNVFGYQIESVALNQEVYSPNPADAWVMGSSFEALGMFEIY